MLPQQGTHPFKVTGRIHSRDPLIDKICLDRFSSLENPQLLKAFGFLQT